MNKPLSSKQKKDLAYSKYMSDDVTQVELAEFVGVSKVTINKWINEGKWADMKQTLSITREEQLKNFSTQLTALNNDIKGRKEGANFPSSKEVDIQIKLAKAIELFKGDMNLADFISYTKKLIKFLRKNHPDKVKEYTLILNEAIQEEV